MKTVHVTLNKIFIKEFYRRQAGFFLFLFLVFFGIVAPSMQLAYHYALIRGMFEAPAFMALVGLAWLLYAWKVHSYVAGVLAGPEYLFLHQLRALPRVRVYRLFGHIQLLLLLPVLSYAFVVFLVGLHLHSTGKAVGVLGYVGLLGLVGTTIHVHRLRHPGGEPVVLSKGSVFRRITPYWSILLRFVLREKILLLTGIKLFSCSILYLLLRTQTPEDYDLRLPYLACYLALFGHGILLYRCRELEAKSLLGYRALPVPLTRRFLQIALFCGLLLLPEMLMLGWLTPHPIRSKDALSLLLSGYSLLLLLFSLLNAAALSTGNYLKLCLVLFGILYVGVLGSFLIVLSGFFLVTALMLFKRGY